MNFLKITMLVLLIFSSSCSLESSIFDTSTLDVKFVTPAKNEYSNSHTYTFKLDVETSNEELKKETAVLKIFESNACEGEATEQYAISENGTAEAINLKDGQVYSAMVEVRLKETVYQSACSQWLAIDTQKPTSVAVSYPDRDTYISSKNMFAEWTEAVDQGISGLQNKPYRIRLYGEANCAGPVLQMVDSSEKSFTFQNLTHGVTYSIEASAVDRANNESNLACSAFTEIDLYAPGFELSDSSSVPGYSRNVNPTITFNNDLAGAYWCLTPDMDFTPISHNEICPQGAGTQNGWFTSRPTVLPTGTSQGLKNFALWVFRADGSLMSNKKISSGIIIDTVPPGNFNVVGIAGSKDQVYDNYLTSSAQISIQWTNSISAIDYDLSIKDLSDKVLCQRKQIPEDLNEYHFDFDQCKGLINGQTYKVVVHSYDIARNVTQTPDFLFQVDRTPPGAFTIGGISGGLDTTVDNFIGATVPTVHFSNSQYSAFYRIQIKDSFGTPMCPLESVASPANSFDYLSVSGASCILLHGRTYYAHVVAYDEGLNFTLATNNPLAFQVDTHPPEVVISTTTADVTKDTSVTFSATFTDQLSGFSHAQCSLDGGTYTACGETATYTGLSAGIHSFEIRAYDIAGNTASAMKNWTIDLSRPTLTINARPPAISNQTSVAFEFSAIDSSGVIGYQCALNSSAMEDCVSPTSYAVVEGSYTFKVKTTDAVGWEQEANYSFLIDHTPATTQFTNTPPAISGDTSSSIHFTGVDTGGSGIARFECSWGAGSYNTCVSPYLAPSLTDGTYKLNVRAIDFAGNVGPAVEHAWSVYTTGPVIQWVTTPEARNNHTDLNIEFNTTTPSGVSVSSIQCSIDGSVFTNCSSPLALTTLAEGNHTLRVRATDSLGNTGAIASTSWITDLNAPNLIITKSPDSVTNNTSAEFEFSATDTEGGTIDGYECRLNGGTFQACASPNSFESLTQQNYTFEVRAKDGTGNMSAPVSRSFLIDLTAPTITITSAPDTISSSTSASISFTGVDTGGANIHHFECAWGTESFSTCVSPFTRNSLSDGDYVVKIRAVDNAGNIGSSTNHSWSVYTSGPQIQWTAVPAPKNKLTTINAEFTTSVPQGVSVTQVQCSLDGGIFSACSTPLSLSGISQGNHTLNVRAIDSLGNTGPTTSTSWTTDLTGPTSLITAGPLPISNNTTAVFEFSAMDAEGSGIHSYECRLNSGAFETCSSPKSYSSLPQQTHIFQVRAKDDVGNLGASASRSFLIDITAPTTNLTAAPETTSNSTAPSIHFTGTDIGGSNIHHFECAWGADVYSSCTSPLGRSSLADGAYEIKIRAVDHAGNIGLPATHSWSIYTAGPQVELTVVPEARNNDVNATAEFTATVPQDLSVAAFQCSLDGASFATCSSPFSKLMAHGTHTFQVRATDSLGNIGPTSSTTWFTDLNAPSVVITSGPASLIKDHFTQFAFVGTDADGSGIANYQCQMDNGAFETCVSPKSYTTLSEGSHTFTVRSTDGVGNISSDTTRSFVTDYTSPSVNITSGPMNPTESTTTANVQFTVTDSNGIASTQCSLNGAAYTNCSSSITYSGLTGGPQSVSIRATDNVGRTETKTHMWTLNTYSWSSGVYGSCNASQPTWSSGSWGTCSAAKPTYDYGSWSTCSKTCGGGTRTRTRSCDTTSGYETRGVSCSTTTGTQSRTVSCLKHDGAIVADANCITSKPLTSQSCTRTDCTIGSQPASSRSCTRNDCSGGLPTSESCNTQACVCQQWSYQWACRADNYTKRSSSTKYSTQAACNADRNSGTADQPPNYCKGVTACTSTTVTCP